MSSNLLSGDEILRLAIEIPNKGEILRKVKQSDSLVKIIEDLCKEFNIKYIKGQFAFQLQDATNRNRYKYIIEANRDEIKNGCILKLVSSPSVMTATILDYVKPVDISQVMGEKGVWALGRLKELVLDPLFAREFFRQDGLSEVFRLIIDRRLPVPQLEHCLKTIDILMEQRSDSFLTNDVIQRIVEFVVGDKTPGLEVVASALSILAKLVAKYDNDYVARTVGLEQLHPHFWNHDSEIQKNVMRLLNAMLRTRSRNKRVHATLVSRDMKELINNQIVKSSTPIDAEMGKELFNYQLMILSYKEKKFDACIDPHGRDSKGVQEITSIISALTDEQMRSSIGSLLDDHVHMPLLKLDDKTNPTDDIMLPTKKGMGYFRSQSAGDNRALDRGLTSGNSDKRPMTLNISPDSGEHISRLTLDCMLYFAKCYSKQSCKMFLSDSSTCQRLMKLVSDVLGIKKNKKLNTKKYQPLLFSEPSFVEELFCRMFLQMVRTRRDMKARTRSDQEKVMWILQRQLIEALYTQPPTLLKLTQELRRFNYDEISNILEKERRTKENMKMKSSPPILELKDSRREEIISLIQQQRIHTLIAGTMFPKTGQRNQKFKKRSTFVSLTKNERSLNYHDCDENGRIIPDTSGKVNLSDVQSVTFGKKCPHIVKEGKTNNKADYEFAFSLIMDQDSSFDFIAQDQTVYDNWTDGINTLLGNNMASDAMKNDLEQLLDMEVRLQLLELNIDEIPNEPPIIPSEPPNYNFQVRDD